MCVDSIAVAVEHIARSNRFVMQIAKGLVSSLKAFYDYYWLLEPLGGIRKIYSNPLRHLEGGKKALLKAVSERGAAKMSCNRKAHSRHEVP